MPEEINITCGLLNSFLSLSLSLLRLGVSCPCRRNRLNFYVPLIKSTCFLQVSFSRLVLLLYSYVRVMHLPLPRVGKRR